ncbi:glycosyltransferase family 2 protein [Pelagibacteraceae bacterium]|nr:glycosyltransferase family 2 protein [Pelagibacteraceae bacterium]
MSYKDITIVITSFKSQNKIISCLDSIKTDIKVLVIENSNNIGFKESIEDKYSNISCILTGENLGYGNGNNLGLSKVKTKYALIINPDAILDSTAIDNFLISAKKEPDFAIISPYVQDEYVLEKKKITIKNLKSVDNVKGFAMFLNISEFEKIGFFDKNFFIYFEEIDLCKRIKSYNKKIFLDPNIRIFHKGGSSHDQSVDMEMELSRNWHWMWSSFYYHKKHYGFFFSILKVFPKLVSSIFKIFFFLLIFDNHNRKIYFQRFSGLFNSILGKKSWYRPKVD